jgi:hypothetical protein
MSKQPKKKAPPPWIEEGDAVYKLVQSELQAADLEVERRAAMFWAERMHLIPDRTRGELRREIVESKEREALDAWRRGDRKPLADLVDPDDPLLDHLLKRHDRPIPRKDRPLRIQLSAETWSIIRDSLLGKLPGKRGRPKMTAEERRMLNPIHDAGDMAPVIERILRQHYPNQLASQVKDRAYAFAEKLKGIDNPQSAGSKVRDYLNSGKKDRRRTP